MTPSLFAGTFAILVLWLIVDYLGIESTKRHCNAAPLCLA